MATRDTGNLGETIACQFLMNKGFRILERNYRKPWGEIDVIAEKAGIIRFVEVKAVTREKGAGFSRETSIYRPEEQVHPKKLEKIARTAESYMIEKSREEEYQIDVVAVFLDPVTHMAECSLYEAVS